MIWRHIGGQYNILFNDYYDFSIHIGSCKCHMLAIFNINVPKPSITWSCKVLKLQKYLQLCYNVILFLWWYCSSIAKIKYQIYSSSHSFNPFYPFSLLCFSLSLSLVSVHFFLTLSFLTSLVVGPPRRWSKDQSFSTDLLAEGYYELDLVAEEWWVVVDLWWVGCGELWWCSGGLGLWAMDFFFFFFVSSTLLLLTCCMSSTL